MNATHKKRLKKLADAMRKKPPKEFDIGLLRVDKPGCGSICCAIGECPRVFPRHWEYCPSPDLENHFRVELKGRSECRMWYESAGLFFGLTVADVSEIFSSIGYLSIRVTPKMVAAKIDGLLRREKAGA